MSVDDKKDKVFTYSVFVCWTLLAVLMYVRAFYGTEITDEAYYVAQAKSVLGGNVPVSHISKPNTGFVALPAAAAYIYSFFVPDMEGLFLFIRLCFVSFKLLICCVIYYVLRKSIQRQYALLLAGLVLPMYGFLPNFSYVTVPLFALLLTGVLLYDVIEQDDSHKFIKLATAGGALGLACCANLGWGLAAVIFPTLMIFRIKEKKSRWKMTGFFVGAACLAVALLIVPCIMATSVAEFLYGFYRIVIAPIPFDSLDLNAYRTWNAIFDNFKAPIKIWIVFFVPITVMAYGCLSQYYSKTGKEYKRLDCIVLSILISMFAQIAYLIFINRDGNDPIMLMGMEAFAGLCYLILFMIMGLYREDKIVLYLALYPVTYSLATIVLVGYAAPIWRCVTSFTIFLPLLYALSKNECQLVRMSTAAVAVLLITGTSYMDFHVVYRDENIGNLTHKVASGIYKGLYTTAIRAKDLPEFEKYLNGIVGKDETYAFRDNVPSGYLVMHNGNMCDFNTWDCLQYAEECNSPAVVFDYYKRRNRIPDKIIYVEYWIYKTVSVDNSQFRYNDFVNAYYDLIADVELNETFKRVRVYQYNGKFDGNYQYWIDTYWQPTKQKKKHSLF